MGKLLRASVYPVLFVAVVGSVWFSGRSDSTSGKELQFEYAPPMSFDEHYDADLSIADVNTSDGRIRVSPD